MDSNEMERLALKLAAAAGKTRDAIKEARPAFEKTVAMLRDAKGEHERRAQLEEELGATIANLRKAEEDLIAKYSWLLHEAMEAAAFEQKTKDE